MTSTRGDWTIPAGEQRRSGSAPRAFVPFELVESSFRGAGLERWGLVDEAVLREACEGLSDSQRGRYGLDCACGAVAAALAYGECEEGPVPGLPSDEPAALIARFARANWYAELSARLKSAVSLIRAGLAQDPELARWVSAPPDLLSARNWRYLANSGLPEKRLALEAGLGSLGRHGLAMVEGPGSAIILGILILPLPVSGGPEKGAGPGIRDRGTGLPSMDPRCEGCGACVAACPTGALRDDGGFDRELCLQHWSSIPGVLPAAVKAAWGGRLYGCDACQEACSLFAPDPGARTGRGRLGKRLSAPWILRSSEAELRAALRGSALGMGWISVGALKRNAELALRGARR